MALGACDSRLFAPLFADPEVAALLDERALVRAMTEVEVAIAEAEAALGVIPQAAAARIAERAADFAPDLEALARSTSESGLPVIGFVAELRRHVAGEAAHYLHWGATSQDIMDTALVVQLRALLDVYAARLDTAIDALARLAVAQRATLMTGRTRSQAALPITFALKAAAWLAPLLRHRHRLAELRPRLLCVQFGGAAGTLAPLGDKGVAVMEAIAARLGLAVPPMPWHTQRDGLLEFAGWLALVTGSLGKIGQDVALLAQSEVAEVREGGAGRGGSSTMPQKANPIGAEILVTLARLNAGLLGTLHQAAIQEHERGGSGWSMEWALLPQMAATTGASLRHACDLILHLDVDAERMRANLDVWDGLILAEAATFALAEHMPRERAQQLVKQAVAEARSGGGHVMDLLARRSDAPVDWKALRRAENYLGSAAIFVDRVLAAARKDGAGG